MQFGYDISGKELEDVFRRFKEVAEKKKVNSGIVLVWLIKLLSSFYIVFHLNLTALYIKLKQII